MRKLRYIAAIVGVLTAILAVPSFGQAVLETVPYTGVGDKATCLADSNAVKIDQGQPLDGDPVWPVDCINCVSHALQVTDVSVVGEVGQPPAKPEWSLRHALTQIGGSRGAGTALGDFLGTMIVEQVINGFTVAPRPDIEKVLLKPWWEAVGAADFAALVRILDGKDAAADDAWSKAPFKLVSIGYRPDLVRPDFEAKRIGAGGEGRLIFQATTGTKFEAMLIIFEYTLPARNAPELVGWTKQYDDLRKLPFGAAYNDALVKITRQFTDRNPKYAVPNNVTLGQLRTNELLVLGNFDWELREFRISHNGKLEPAAVQMNPDLSFNTDAKATLLAYLASPDFDGTFPNTTIPWSFEDRPFLAGSSITPVSFVNDTDTWLTGEAGLDPAVRERFASTTCNGCHGDDAPREVAFPGKKPVLNPGGIFQTGFTHVDARGKSFGRPNDTILSDFMCQSDLVARVAAFQLFRDQPAAIENLLFGTGPREAFPSAQSAENAAAVAAVARNLARVH